MTTSEMISIIRTATGKENLMNEYTELLKKYEAAQARIAELERTIDAKDAELSTAQLVIEDQAKDIYCLEGQVENLEAEVEEMKTLITKKDYERIELEEDNAMLNNKTMELREIINRPHVDDKIMELMKIINRMASEMDALRKENQDLTKRLIDIAFIANGGEYDNIDDDPDELPF